MLRRDDLLGRLKRERHDPLPNKTYTAPPGGGGGGAQDSYRPIIYQPVYTNDMPSHRQIIEHQVRPVQPVQQVLPPIAMPANPPPAIYGGYPQMITMPTGSGSSWNKGDFMEMMMMQNAQMHQMVMNQMMLSSMPTPPRPQVIRSAPDEEVHERKPAVHHHHYSGYPSSSPGPSPVISHITHLPPIDLRIRRPMHAPPPPPPPVERFPSEVEPLAQPRARLKPKLVSPVPSPQPPPSPITSPKRKPIVRGEYPFPGTRGLRRLRHTFYAAFFTAALRDSIKKRKMFEVSDVFIFGIHLKEAVAALHRIYLNPDGKTYPILRDLIIGGAPDYSVLAEAPGKQVEKELYGDLNGIVRNLIFNITEIMPSAGVLGTHRKAVVYELIKSGKKFPRGYFWQTERALLKFNSQERTVDIGNAEASMMLIGVFFSRALITTLLMKPIDYGLSKEKLDNIAQHNLMFIATLVVMVVRIASVPPGRPSLVLPQEITRFLYRDEDMKAVFQKLKSSIDECVKYIREWSAEYIRKLREVERNDSRQNTAQPPAGGSNNLNAPRSNTQFK